MRLVSRSRLSLEGQRMPASFSLISQSFIAEPGRPLQRTLLRHRKWGTTCHIRHPGEGPTHTNTRKRVGPMPAILNVNNEQRRSSKTPSSRRRPGPTTSLGKADVSLEILFLISWLISSTSTEHSPMVTWVPAGAGMTGYILGFYTVGLRAVCNNENCWMETVIGAPPICRAYGTATSATATGRFSASRML